MSDTKRPVPREKKTVALSIDNLRVVARPEKTREIDLVRGIDLQLRRGEIHGLAGESGSGKTMTALATLGLLPKGTFASGSIELVSAGVDLLGQTQRQMREYRGAHVSMVFQDPSTSLHPQLKVETQLTDHMRAHLGLSKRAARERAVEQLDRVRVPDPANALKKYPHQFSGGQRQRIAIAVALACDPEILLADEPTTALDVTVQAGILSLLRQLVEETDLAVLLVTHDLGVMSSIADVVSVMRNGELVESADRADLFQQPQHSYTKALLDAMPGAPNPVPKIRAVEAEPSADANITSGAYS